MKTNKGLTLPINRLYRKATENINARDWLNNWQMDQLNTDRPKYR